MDLTELSSPEVDWSTPAVQLAPALLGSFLVSESPQGAVVVRVTEVEAYAGADDPGSHAYRGRTARTAVMFGPGGHWYVYFSYGMHWCANVVCGPQGTASAVLLRAGQVVQGLELARSRRRPARTDRDLARGPACLTKALGVDGAMSGASAVSVPLRLAQGQRPASVLAGPRVGVSGAGGDGATFPWRFWIEGEDSVSVYRPAVARSRRDRAG